MENLTKILICDENAEELRLLVDALAHNGYRSISRAVGGEEALELAVTFCEKNSRFKVGDLLELGNPYFFGGAKLAWGQGMLHLPDGTKEPINYDWEMGYGAQNLFYALTASRGWEWFNSVRNEERFKAYIERARSMTNK